MSLVDLNVARLRHIGSPSGILVYSLLSDVNFKIKHSRLDRMECHRHAGNNVILQYFSTSSNRATAFASTVYL